MFIKSASIVALASAASVLADASPSRLPGRIWGTLSSPADNTQITSWNGTGIIPFQYESGKSAWSTSRVEVSMRNTVSGETTFLAGLAPAYPGAIITQNFVNKKLCGDFTLVAQEVQVNGPQMRRPVPVTTPALNIQCATFEGSNSPLTGLGMSGKVQNQYSAPLASNVSIPLNYTVVNDAEKDYVTKFIDVELEGRENTPNAGQTWRLATGLAPPTDTSTQFISVNLFNQNVPCDADYRLVVYEAHEHALREIYFRSQAPALRIQC